jgi:hypothetical protein
MRLVQRMLLAKRSLQRFECRLGGRNRKVPNRAQQSPTFCRIDPKSRRTTFHRQRLLMRGDRTEDLRHHRAGGRVGVEDHSEDVEAGPLPLEPR